MGKHGPCCHCGITSTPLWRNGPPDKPVLCNACGSRWRTKGSLYNYTPLHARDLIAEEDIKVSKPKSIPFKPKEKKLQKIKRSCGAVKNEREMPCSDQNIKKVMEGDMSNWSCSGSVTSYAESCAHFGTTEASDLTGSAQSNVWESQVPSKKRTYTVPSEPSPLEKLTQDLYAIMNEQQSSHLSSPEEDLLYESETPMGSFEIRSGSILLRYPNSKSAEEESEASSRSISNKSYITNEAHSGSTSFPVNRENKGTNFPAVGEKFKKSIAQLEKGHVERDNFYTDELHILQDRDSPLGFTDLKNIANFEVLMSRTTNEEQQRLMKYLPSTDTAKYPDSLRTMFNSPQFEETLSYFQQLLQEGIFESYISGTNAEEYRTLKILALQNFSRSSCDEHYRKIKDIRRNKHNTGGMERPSGSNYNIHSKFTPLKRSRDTQNLHVPEPSLKRVAKSGGRGTNPVPTDTNPDFVGNDDTCFSPSTIFASPPERTSMLYSFQVTDNDDISFNHGLLLSAPEAQLLYHPWNHKHSSAGSGVVEDGEESLSSFPASSLSRQTSRNR